MGRADRVALVDTVVLDPELVRCLLREQFPQWADARVHPVEVQGWDNRTFRVGESLVARLPSGEGYASAVSKEHRWLPVLAPQLPVAVPVPVARGRPGCGYRWPWSLYRWLPGMPACADDLAGSLAFAEDLAGFLVALQSVSATSGPVPGSHNGWRGGPVTTYDEETRTTAAAMASLFDLSAVLKVWDAAVHASTSGDPVWVHGDMTASNLLVQNNRLTAVIDFGSCAVGDPACDLVIAWTFLDGQARAAFRELVPLDGAAWARARGWALWKALLTLAQGAEGRTAERRYGWRTSALELIDELITDHAVS